ncbi:DNRLRE domain-containing protein [Ferruginibacter albus]|uniref:DNRLRE domain-containing protein n=1 Tax=Ferruginibacter albus TaxID=2875540 RepID=UPI001CC6C231|nr:DNRLRE domain-containing protein [Ferruginibacter albus]UAY50961.1 DNRLRE domain-containing protein [Ferruginibacter albus]
MKLIRLSAIILLITTGVLTSCKKDNPAPFVVDAGSTAIVQLPKDTITLTGTVISGQTANMHYLWSLISGPSNATIASNTAASSLISGLIQGSYVFQFQATNGNGDIAVDTISVAVVSAGIQTLSLPIAPLGFGGTYSFLPDQTISADSAGKGSYLYMSAWTVNSVPTHGKTYLKFDWSQIPANATILSAQLELSSLTQSEFTALTNGATTDPQAGTDNSLFVQRITSDWSVYTITYNNAPASTATDQAIIPQYTTGTTTIDVDVTTLVKDMNATNNYGFCLGLVYDHYYNQRAFAGNTFSDASRRPKLTIRYQ